MNQKQLPLSVRLALQAAAKTPITPQMPLARVKAIEAVIAKARAEHPEFFTQE